MIFRQREQSGQSLRLGSWWGGVGRHRCKCLKEGLAGDPQVGQEGARGALKTEAGED